MRLNKKILKNGSILLILLTIICIGLQWHLRLREPVFIKSYAQYLIDSENDSVEFPIQYITNRDKSSFMWNISFVEHPELNVNVNYSPSMFPSFSYVGENEEIADLYKIQTVYVTINNVSDLDLKNLNLNKAVVSFSDSSTMEVDLGQIELIQYEYKEGGLSTFSFSGSNQGDTSVSYEANKKIYLTSIINPYSEILGESLTLKILGDLWSYQLPCTYEVNLKNFVLQPEETITVYSFLDVSNEKELKYANIDIRPLFIYQDEQGRTFEEIINNINYSPYFNNWWDVYQFIKESR